MSSDTYKFYEAKIAELDEDRQHWLDNTIKNIGNPNYNSLMDSINQAKAEQASYLLQEILALATILPVEESWDDFQDVSDSLYRQEDYPNGVIIQPKQ
jgi:dipeptidase